MILKSRIRKVVKNVVADHLSRLEIITGTEKGTEMAEICHDEQLFMLLVQTPLYSNIVNYLASGVISFEFSYQ